MQRGLPPRALQRLEEILELSGNVLLDLTVVTCDEWPASSPKKMPSSAVFPVIHKHSQRCKHLTLDGHLHFVLQFFKVGPIPHSFNSESGTLSPQFPSLRSLELDIFADKDTEPALMVLHIPSASAPNLRNLCIMNAYYYDGDLAFDLPWRQLDTLMFGVRHLSEFFDALSDATSLTQACLHDCIFVREIQPSRPISSDTLTSLRFILFDDITYNAMSTCFEEFTLPHLRELHICGEAVDGESYVHTPNWPTDPFKAFVIRSGFPITKLTILGVPMRDTTLIDILECLPRLEALVAAEPGSDDFSEGVEAEEYKLSCLTNHLMERLQVRVQELSPITPANASVSDPNCEAEDLEKAESFLPSLREINLQGKGSADTFSLETFLEMVRTRRAAAMAHPEGGICILKTVVLRIRDQPIEQAVQKTIDNLRLCHEDLVLDVVSSC
jgi:hypothetical protein